MSDAFFDFLTVTKADDLVAYYRLGEASGSTCTDSGPRSYPLTYAGTPTFGQTGLVKNSDNDAIIFPSSSEYANSSTTISTGNTDWDVQNITAIACVSGTPTSYTAPNGGYMDIWQRSAGSYNSWAINIRDDGYVEFGTTDTGLAYHGLVSSSTLVDNERTLIICTFEVDSDTGDAVKALYVNGERVAVTLTGTQASIGYGSADNVTIGYRTASGWVGIIDEVSFLQNALSSNDAYQLSEAFNGKVTNRLQVKWTHVVTIQQRLIWSYLVEYQLRVKWHYLAQIRMRLLWTQQAAHRVRVPWKALVDTTNRIRINWTAKDTVTYRTRLKWRPYARYHQRIRWAALQGHTHRTRFAWKGLPNISGFVNYNIRLPWNTSQVNYNIGLRWGYTFNTAVTYRTRLPWKGLTVNPVTYRTRLPWNADTGSYQSIPSNDLSIEKNGARIEITDATITSQEGSPYLQAVIDLATPTDLYKFQLDDAFTLKFFGTDYSLVVSSSGTSESRSSLTQINHSPQVTGLSPVYLQSNSVAQPSDIEFTYGALATTAVGTLLDQPVAWEVLDWAIPAYRISASDVAPLEVAKTIPEAIGASIQSKPDGSLLVRSDFPVSVQDLDRNATVTLTLRADRDVYRTDRSMQRRRFYNLIIVANGDPDATQDTMEFVFDNDSRLRGNMFIYPQPYRRSVRLLTDRNGVSIGPLLEITRTIVEENLEVINGQVTLKHPPFIILGTVWGDTPQGAITIQGNVLTTAAGGNTLLTISYRTRHLAARASTSSERKALFVLQES